MTRPRIVIADDHQIFAEGLQVLLGEDYDVIGVVEDGEALLRAIRDLDPDLVVADVSMPGMSGIECVRKLRESGLDTKVILLTMHAEIEYAVAALQAGASGYVVKAAGAAELKSALEEALRGGVHISADIAKAVIAALAAHRSGAPDLSPRQRDVLSGLARGLTAKEVAAELSLSPRTVETHKYQLMEKLGVTTSAGLIQYALRHGIGPV